MENNSKSQVIQFLDLVWNGVNHNKTNFSWVRLNDSMRRGLHLAIISQLKFDIDDFDYISKHYRWGYWASDGEQFYFRAILENNVSAIKSIEKHWNRKPFITDNVSLQKGSMGHSERKRCRLCVGAEFYWNGERVTVTSFKDKEALVIACSYTPYEADDRGYFTKGHDVKHIYKISHKDLKDNSKKVGV